MNGGCAQPGASHRVEARKVHPVDRTDQAGTPNIVTAAECFRPGLEASDGSGLGWEEQQPPAFGPVDSL